MSYTFNIFTGNFDAVDNIAPALLFKGSIDIPGDFPTSALVQNGWFYTITSDVTDDDATKTNTGQSFNALDEIAWNGTNWTIIGNEGIYVPYTGADKAVDLSSQNLTTTGAVNTGTLTATGTGSFGGAVDMNSHQINEVTDPTDNQDAATKNYVDANDFLERESIAAEDRVKPKTDTDTVFTKGRVEAQPTATLTAGQTFNPFAASGSFSSDGTGGTTVNGLYGTNRIVGTNWVNRNDFSGMKFFGGYGLFGSVGNPTVNLIGSQAIGNSGFAQTGLFNDVIGSKSIVSDLLSSSCVARNGISNVFEQAQGNFFPSFDTNVGTVTQLPTFGDANYQAILNGYGAGSGQFIGSLFYKKVISDVKNSEFSSATPNWTNDGSWDLLHQIFGNYAWRHTPGTVFPTVLTSAYLDTGAIKSGKTYRIETLMKEASYVSGGFTISLGTNSASAITKEGANIQHIVASGDDVSLTITPTSDFEGSIDYVLVTPMDSFGHSRLYNPEPSKFNIAIDVDGTETDMIEVTPTGTKINTGLIIPSGTTPAPAVEGALFLDTDASTNGDLMMYSNSAWRIVKTL